MRRGLLAGLFSFGDERPGGPPLPNVQGPCCTPTGTHSAARWTLNQWQVPLPEIPSSRDPVNGKQWFVNSLNMTMLRIPEGKFFRLLDSEQQKVRLTRPFFLSDWEISVAMFRQFINDVDYQHEKPDNWEGAYSSVSLTPDHPVQHVNWYDAVMFCNWLSHREQLPVCYEKHAGFRRGRTPNDA